VVQVTVARGVATLTLDSPANRNALSRAMRGQLRAGLTDALADDAVRVVVLDHTGRVFCSGMDLSEAAGGGAQEQGVREFPELLNAIWSAPKPVVAAVRGPARAGGVGLLAACDVAVAAADARFFFPEVGIGLAPALVLAWLPRLVGEREACWLTATGEKISAARAREIGLLNAVAGSAEELAKEVDERIAALRSRSPRVHADIRDMLRAFGAVGEDQALDMSIDRLVVGSLRRGEE